MLLIRRQLATLIKKNTRGYYQKIEDKSYKGLFYYKLNKEDPFYELSFKDSKQDKLTEAEVIAHYVKEIEQFDHLSLNPTNFITNKSFLSRLHKIIQKNVLLDESLKNYANFQKEGWIHINDERNPAPFGRIADTEDIIGSVLIKDCTILPDTYQPMPSYRLFTKSHGLIQLADCYKKELI